MNIFSWSKAFGFGALIWLIMFAIVSALVGFDVTMTSIWWALLVAVIAGFASYIFAGYSNMESSGQAFGYGIIWVIIGLVLDFIVTKQFEPNIFSSWVYWGGYALVLLAPWFRLEARSGSHAPA